MMRPVRKPDLVVFSHVRWLAAAKHFRQLLARYAITHRVLYVEDAVPARGPTRCQLVEDAAGICSATPVIDPKLSPLELRTSLRRLYTRLYESREVETPVTWINAPTFMATTRHLPARAVVYSVVDELDKFPGVTPDLRRLEDDLFARADVVLCADPSLFEKRRGRHPWVHLFPPATAGFEAIVDVVDRACGAGRGALIAAT